MVGKLQGKRGGKGSCGRGEDRGIIYIVMMMMKLSELIVGLTLKIRTDGGLLGIIFAKGLAMGRGGTGQRKLLRRCVIMRASTRSQPAVLYKTTKLQTMAFIRRSEAS